jgi:hypothetical protein
MAQYTELDSPAAVVRGLRSSSTIGSCRKLKGKDLAASPGPPTRMKDHDATLPIRHGLTLMRQFVPLVETDRLVFKLRRWRSRQARSIRDRCLSFASRVRAGLTGSDRR